MNSAPRYRLVAKIAVPWPIPSRRHGRIPSAAETTSLREGQPTGPVLSDPASEKQGINSRGQICYYGTRPPLGDGPHSYHFQLFALDIPEPGLEPGATRQDVPEAMKAHVVAQGELVGSYERPAAETPRN